MCLGGFYDFKMIVYNYIESFLKEIGGGPNFELGSVQIWIL